MRVLAEANVKERCRVLSALLHFVSHLGGMEYLWSEVSSSLVGISLVFLFTSVTYLLSIIDLRDP